MYSLYKYIYVWNFKILFGAASVISHFGRMVYVFMIEPFLVLSKSSAAGQAPLLIIRLVYCVIGSTIHQLKPCMIWNLEIARYD